LARSGEHETVPLQSLERRSHAGAGGKGERKRRDGLSTRKRAVEKQNQAAIIARNLARVGRSLLNIANLGKQRLKLKRDVTGVKVGGGSEKESGPCRGVSQLD